MTTPPAHEGSSSQVWVAIDATRDVSTRTAQLDVGRESLSARRVRATNLAMLDLKPGQRVLEVGPGTGAFSQEMAALVAPSGHVTGVDISSSMVAVASKRAANTGLPVTFQQGDVHNLDFSDGAFDACFASLVFMHIDDPIRALQELVRVTRPGGCIVISEPDNDMIVFDAPDYEASRTVTEAFMRAIRDPRMGRKLPRLFKQAGLTQVIVETQSVVFPDRQTAWARAAWADAVQSAIQEGQLPQERADAWIESLDRASQEGYYFQAFTRFSVVGRKP